MFSLTAEHETGASYLIETVHGTLTANARMGWLSKFVLVQLDEGAGENTNQYGFDYFGSSVVCKLFHLVALSNLHVGPTQRELYQGLSCTPVRLYAQDAIILDDLHAELLNVYEIGATIFNPEHIAKILALS